MAVVDLAFPRGRAAEDGVGGEGEAMVIKIKHRQVAEVADLSGSISCARDVDVLPGVYEGGQIWMLCTPAILKFPHTFAREAKRYVNSRQEKLLWNFVDERNKIHLKLLRFLGFKFLRRFPYGPNNLSFIEFCRVQSSSDRTSSVRDRRSSSSVRE